MKTLEFVITTVSTEIVQLADRLAEELLKNLVENKEECQRLLAESEKAEHDLDHVSVQVQVFLHDGEKEGGTC